MRDALDALRTYLAYELHDDHAPELARIDAQVARVEQLWIERPPEEIRGAVGSALATALDDAYALGGRLMAV
jgi:signal transduction histidine kinase